jgi:hypothetical protein
MGLTSFKSASLALDPVELRAACRSGSCIAAWQSPVLPLVCLINPCGWDCHSTARFHEHRSGYVPRWSGQRWSKPLSRAWKARDCPSAYPRMMQALPAAHGCRMKGACVTEGGLSLDAKTAPPEGRAAQEFQFSDFLPFLDNTCLALVRDFFSTAIYGFRRPACAWSFPRFS